MLLAAREDPVQPRPQSAVGDQPPWQQGNLRREPRSSNAESHFFIKKNRLRTVSTPLRTPPASGSRHAPLPPSAPPTSPASTTSTTSTTSLQPPFNLPSISPQPPLNLPSTSHSTSHTTSHNTFRSGSGTEGLISRYWKLGARLDRIHLSRRLAGKQ